MIKIRSHEERGHTSLDWLSSYHSFSFADYVHPDYTNFRTLRVINEDVIAPGGGFQTHGHRDMEIITYVYEGALEHKDSEGNGSVIRPGQIQRMSAGTGIRHSEFNHSKTEPVSLLQIWIVPKKQGLKPSYEEASFDRRDLNGKWAVLGSEAGGAGQVKIHQDVRLLARILKKDEVVEFSLEAKRYGWLQVVRGEVLFNNTPFRAGDGAAITDKADMTLIGSSETDAEVLYFDLA